MPKAILADHMLHAAGLLFRCFWIDTCFRQQVGKEAVFLVGLLGYLPAHIGQTKEEIPVHGEKAALFQGCYPLSRLLPHDTHWV